MTQPATQPVGDFWFRETEGGQGLSLQVTRHLHHSQSPFQSMDVFESPAYGRVLLLDGLVMTTDKDEYVYHEMITHVPLCLHPQPKRVLVIGGGDGGTVREVCKHHAVETVLMCEIDGAVIDVCREYFPYHTSALDDPRVTVQVADAIAMVKTRAQSESAIFDAILIDSSDPVGPGEGLFTPEFYAAALKLLAPDGVLSAQTHSPFDPSDMFEKTFATLRRAFSGHAYPYFATVPTYPRGLWSWTLALPPTHPLVLDSGGFNSAVHAGQAVAERLCRTSQLQYFTPQIHHSCFAQPAFVQRMLSPVTVS